MCDIERDESKRASNLRKHGVDFADAAGVLLDEHNLTREDPDAGGEPRFVTLGRGYSERLLLVVWTERIEGVIRIIGTQGQPRRSRRLRGLNNA